MKQVNELIYSYQSNGNAGSAVALVFHENVRIDSTVCLRATSADMMFWRKNETVRGPVRLGTSLSYRLLISSNFCGIDAQQMLICERRQPILPGCSMLQYMQIYRLLPQNLFYNAYDVQVHI